MNFDVVIIGGGLAGLVAGIALQRHGKQCAIINNGQAALDFSSGSFDLLNQHFVDFAQEIATSLPPQHPYRILGSEQVLKAVAQFEPFAHSTLGLLGSHQQNHWRVTPLGSLRQSWLTPVSVPRILWGEQFGYQKIKVIGIAGYHDFQSEMLVDNLKRQAAFTECEISYDYLQLDELDELRQTGREFRSVHIAEFLEHHLPFHSLVQAMQPYTKDVQALFLPACFGRNDSQLLNSLAHALNCQLFELPTLPPSLLGIRQRKQLCQRFQQLGGILLNGDKAVRADVEQGKVSHIFTQLKGEESLTAQHFILATGRFFSNGLVAQFEGITEPLFNADLQGEDGVQIDNRLSWTRSRFSEAQPFQSVGVIINEQCQVRLNGDFSPNLYAAGSVIGGYQGIEQGCSSGVAVATALTIVEQILASGRQQGGRK